MTDNNFQMPESLPAGAITFRAANEGSQPHDVTLIELPVSLKGSLDKQLRGDKRMAVLPIAVIKPRQPGQSGFFAVDLKPGRYGIVCFVQDPNGVAHAATGMSKELTVR